MSSPTSQQATSQKATRKRLYALDVMRGIAVFLMMEQHIGVWLWVTFASPSQFLKYPLFVGFNALGGGAAPLFVSLAGAGSALFAASRAGRWDPARIDGTLMRRGLGVMAFGYLLNNLTPSWFEGGSWYIPYLLVAVVVLGPIRRRLATRFGGPERLQDHLPTWAIGIIAVAVLAAYPLSAVARDVVDPGSWFVLNLMGVGILLSPLWRRMSTGALLGLAVAILLGTVGLQTWLETDFHLGNNQMRDTTMPGGAMRLALVEGQFPVFPWMALFLKGVVIGRLIVQERWTAITRLTAGALALGVLFAVTFGLMMAGVLPRNLLLLRLVRFDGIFYPCSPAYILLVGGLVTFITSRVMAYERRNGLSEANIGVSLGRASLTLLLLHVWMFRELSRSVGLWSALEAPQAFVGTLVAIGVFWILAVLWRRIGFRYGAEWLLRQTAG
ncbi:MAG: DUF418 domain-containing transporter [Myxococcota bacterium]